MGEEDYVLVQGRKRLKFTPSSAFRLCCGLYLPFRSQLAGSVSPAPSDSGAVLPSRNFELIEKKLSVSLDMYLRVEGNLCTLPSMAIMMH